MNYISQLEKDHSRSNADKIAKAIGNSAAEFEKIMQLIYTAEAPIQQRAAWLLSIVNEKHPELLLPYLKKFIDTIQTFKHPAIKRGMLNVLEKHTIPKKLQGKLVSICFDFILSPNETLAVKVFSLNFIANIAKEQRDLIPELKSVIEDQLPKTTTGFRARAKNILRELKA